MILLKDGAKVKGFAMRIPHSCFLVLTKKKKRSCLRSECYRESEEFVEVVEVNGFEFSCLYLGHQPFKLSPQSSTCQ